MTIIFPSSATDDEKTSDGENPGYYTVHEVAERLRVDDTTVRRWIKTGALPAVTLPHTNKRRSYRISCDAFNALIAGAATDPVLE
jgi:excisionase family DNA binding protein